MKKQSKQKVVKGLPLFILDSSIVPMNTAPEHKRGSQKNDDSFNSPNIK